MDEDRREDDSMPAADDTEPHTHGFFEVLRGRTWGTPSKITWGT